MKAAGTFCVATAILVGAVSSKRFLGGVVPLVGIGSTTPIAIHGSTSTAAGGDSSAILASSYQYTTTTTTVIGSTVGADLVQALEADERITVVAPVEVGELLCDTLEQAEDASVLSFVLRGGETVTAERSSYTAVTHRGTFTDGIGRKVWKGIVTDPAQAEDEAVPRAVSMSWGDVCDTETFLLKVTTRKTDGTTRLSKTVPCDGSSTHTCLVEVSVEFDESSDVIIPDKTSKNRLKDGAEVEAKDKAEAKDMSRDAEAASAGDSNGATSDSRGDGDSSDTVVPVVAAILAPGSCWVQECRCGGIDVMVLYSTSALDTSGVTGQQMETMILEGLVGTNEAFVNSGVSASVNPVHIGLLPYEVTIPSVSDALFNLRLNGDVADLRDAVGADLVMMIGYFPYSCGRGYFFADDGEGYGFSVVSTSCLDNFSHTHELGHNLGCYHNREDSANDEDYAHGYRNCDGDERYETLMSYSCGSTRVNYFSNPEVSYNGQPTGTASENNARAIQDNMVAVSNYRQGPTDTPTAAAPPTPTAVPMSTYYSYVGCYEDDNEDYPVLSGDLLQDDDDMTIEVCAEFCEGSPFFGTRDGTECVCGKASDDPREEEAEICTSECAGNASQACGDRRSMSVYEYLEAAEVAPWLYRGCWADAREGRIMSVMQVKKSMTNDLCTTMCHGYNFYGLQYGRECWCGNESTDYARHGESSTCDVECSGNAETLCGGYYSMDVFEYQRP